MHVGVLEALVNAAYTILALFFLRMLAIKFKDTTLGKGLAVIVL